MSENGDKWKHGSCEAALVNEKKSHMPGVYEHAYLFKGFS